MIAKKKVPLEVLCFLCLSPLGKHEVGLRAKDGTGPYCEDCFPWDADSDEYDDDDDDDDDDYDALRQDSADMEY